MPQQISIILFTVRSSTLPYEEKLKKLCGIGYRAIQGGFVSGLTHAEHRSLLDGMGLEMTCLGGGLEDIEKNPTKYVEGCQALGCDEIMLGTMPTSCRASEEGYREAIGRINAAGKILAKEGIFLSYHNHAQEFRKFSSGKTGMDLLFEGLDPAVARFLPDTHWLQSGGADILQWIEKLRGRVQFLHVKDYRVAPSNYLTGIGETDKQFAAIGDGNLPWPAIVDTALRHGVKSFIVEQDETYDRDPFDCAAQSYQTLKACGLN